MDILRPLFKEVEDSRKCNAPRRDFLEMLTVLLLSGLWGGQTCVDMAVRRQQRNVSGPVPASGARFDKLDAMFLAFPNFVCGRPVPHRALDAARRCSDRVHIALARFEALRSPSGFPDPVSTAVCPCTVLGLSRISGGADLRLELSDETEFQKASFSIDSRAQPLPVSQAETEARNNPFLVAAARTIRAILFADAATGGIGGLLFDSAASQGSSAQSRNAHRITAINPATGSRLRSRCPVFEIPTEFRLSPKSYIGGDRTEPSRKVPPAPEASICGAKAWVAMAQIGTICGMAVKCFSSLLYIARLRTSAFSSSVISSSRIS